MHQETNKTLGYQFATSVDTGRAVARKVFNRYPDFHNKIEDDVKADFVEAFQLRYAENNKGIEQTYIFREGQFMIVGAGEKLSKDSETIKLSVAFAMAESAQKFGQMRTSEDSRQKALYALIKPVRDAVNKYTSNTLKNLQRYVREIANEGADRTRRANLDFDAWLKKFFVDAKAKVKSAHGRGDETADAKLLDEATVAFLTVWNHK